MIQNSTKRSGISLSVSGGERAKFHNNPKHLFRQGGDFDHLRVTSRNILNKFHSSPVTIRNNVAVTICNNTTCPAAAGELKRTKPPIMKKCINHNPLTINHIIKGKNLFSHPSQKSTTKRN